MEIVKHEFLSDTDAAIVRKEAMVLLAQRARDDGDDQHRA
jgi:hypothetical protein